ncbi:MAG: pyridoxal-phosphate dependent enzyme [Planctomycetota bacterium]|nr:pyridoxal-phosphate dependent enzyme [Planctomycetota bacterium]
MGSTLKAIKPEVKIIAVEPEGCPALHASLRADKPMQVECETICDGVAVPYITDEMFPLLRDLVDDCVLVSESSVGDMVRRLALGNKMVVEPSGALAVAAAVQADGHSRNCRVAIVTGGSIDPEKLIRLLQA